MKHRINGRPVNLRSLADDQLDGLVDTNHYQWRRVINETSSSPSDTELYREPAGARPANRVAFARLPFEKEVRTAVTVVVVLTAGLSLVLALFVSLAVNSGPAGVRLAVAGPAPAVEQIKAGITQLAGADSFEVTVVSDEEAARAALKNRTADGAIVVGATGPVVYTAGAGSPVITQALSNAAARLGNPTAPAPTVVDVVPLPTSDARGAGLPAGSFPMIIAGLALGAGCALHLRNRWVVVTTALGGAVVIGFVFAGVLAWLGVSGSHYLGESVAIALTVAAGALLVAGLLRMLGMAGHPPPSLGVGALLLLIVGNPLSGIATSPRFLPAPWGEFGQWLPTGAGGTLVRTASYFPEASVVFPLTILVGWAVLGAIGVIFGRALNPYEAAEARLGTVTARQAMPRRSAVEAEDDAVAA